MKDDDNNNISSFQGWSCDDLISNLCPLQVQEGVLKIRENIDIHYWKYERRRVQDLDDDAAQQQQQHLPIVMIHGGPGLSHDYMLPLKQQACRGRDVYFYNQALCGRKIIDSTLPPFLYEMDYYSQEELPALIQHLNLDKFHLIGNSYGGMIALSYAIAHNHQLASMVLSSTMSDIVKLYEAQWEKHVGPFGGLPPFIRRRIQELAGEYQSEEFQMLAEHMLPLFSSRTWPPPDCLQASLDAATSVVNDRAFGPASTFLLDPNGTMANYNVTSQLHSIHIPVLLTEGAHDVVPVSVIDVLENNIPLTERVRLLDSGHLSMIDQPDDMNDAIARFLDRVEEGSFMSKSDSNDETCSWDASILKWSPWVGLLILSGLFVGVVIISVVYKAKRKALYQQPMR